MTEDDIPFIFNCFTSTTGNINIITFTCEYNENCNRIKKGFSVAFQIKVNSKASLDFKDSDASFDNESRLVWVINELDENKQPSLEIKTTENPSNLFPLNVLLNLDYSLLELKANAFDENKEELLLSFSSTCKAHNLQVLYE